MSSGNRAFYEQREAILAEIGVNFEHVLMNINKLNRSLEGVIAVGNEFGSVEALWSQFENVMGKEPEAPEQAEETVVDTKEEQETAEEEDMTETIEERRR